jgi:solute:Na+ symporter, SSS family
MIIALVYLFICLAIGFYKAKDIQTIKQFALGDGHIATTILIMTTLSTFIGAGAIIGGIDKVYNLGIMFSIALLFEVFSWILTYKIIGNNITRFNGYISLSEIMGLLYGNFAWWLTSIVTILQAIGIIAAQVYAVSYIFAYFFNMPPWLGISLGFGVLITYSTCGGIKAIAITDVLQFTLTFIIMPIVCIISYHQSGGYSGLLDKLPSSHTTINLNGSNIWLFISLAFYSLLPHSESTFIQRFLMSNNKFQIMKSMKIIALITIPFIFFLTFIGLSTYAYDGNLTSGTTFFYFISHYIPAGIVGILIAGLIAIVLSTADSWLNTSAVCFAHNIAKKLFPQMTDKQELITARVSTFVIGILSVILALQGEGVLELIWLADNFWQPLILVPLITGFLGFKIKYQPFVLSTIIATIFTIGSAYTNGGFSTISLTFGVIGSAIGLFGGHLFQIIKTKIQISSRTQVIIK